jgi:hypothetical protein
MMQIKLKRLAKMLAKSANYWVEKAEKKFDHFLYLELVDGHPGIGGESLQHRHQKLETTGPMAN